MLLTMRPSYVLFFCRTSRSIKLSKIWDLNFPLFSSKICNGTFFFFSRVIECSEWECGCDATLVGCVLMCWLIMRYIFFRVKRRGWNKTAFFDTTVIGIVTYYWWYVSNQSLLWTFYCTFSVYDVQPSLPEAYFVLVYEKLWLSRLMLLILLSNSW